jgi:hypothetical protein
MAEQSTVARFTTAISIPALIMIGLGILPIVNYKVGGGLMPHGLVYLIVRLLVVAAAGFLVTSRAKLGIGAAAGAGAAMFFVEQLVNAVWFVIDWQPKSLLGVAQGFAMFVAVAAAVGAVGGAVGRACCKRATAAI